MKIFAAAILSLSFLFCSEEVHAQARRTYWGVSGSVTPNWEVPSGFKALFDADSLDVSGSGFRIGFVRGSVLSGDWGISLVHKPIKDDSTVTRLASTSCSGCGDFFTTSSASLIGIEISRFVPVATIKRRVQFGVNFGGGVGWLKGNAEQLSVSEVGTSTQTVDASVLFAPGGNEIDIVPLARLEVEVAWILGPDIKIRAGSGLDLPGYNKFSVAMVYFFGAR